MTSTSNGREGVHTSMTIRDEGGGGIECCDVMQDSLYDSQNVICWPLAGACCLWWSLLGWLLCSRLQDDGSAGCGSDAL